MDDADREWHDPERAKRIVREDQRDVAGLLLFTLSLAGLGALVASNTAPGDPGTRLGRAGRRDRTVLGVTGGMLIALVTKALTTMAFLESDLRRSHLRTTDTMDAAVDVTRSVNASTSSVRAALDVMAAETARAQRLAVWVGVGTAVLGAVLGGFAGAVAARILGA